MQRVKPGDVIRLYGFPGTFKVTEASPRMARYYDFHATPLEAPGNSGWPALESSVVEINGEPAPLLSAPLCPPASDYPHTPKFEYNDGDPSLTQIALDLWRRQ